MANTSPVYARIDNHLKTEAEGILAGLGITPSSAIQMFYSQIVRTRGIPFPLHLQPQGPTAIGGLSQAEIDEELLKGLASLKGGKGYSADEVDRKLAEDLGL